MKNIINKLFIIFICLIPFGSFFFKQVDIWHGQGQFVQVGILIFFCCSFFEKPKYIQILNKPLGVFTLWAGLVTSYWWIKVFFITQHYPIKVFFPFFNLLCLILLYKLIIEYLDKKSIERILNYLRYSIIIILFYCVLQYLKLDEFYKGIVSGEKLNELVGIMGNRGHMAGFLTIIQPIFFRKELLNILSLILLWFIIFLTGSASALFVGISIILFWLLMKRKYIFFMLGLFSSIILFAFIYFKFPVFFNDNFRFTVWSKAIEMIKKKPITGYGLGFFGVNKLSIYGHGQFQHLHNEWLQIILELGFIGLIFVLWIVWDYFNIFIKNINDLTIKLASIFFGFCILSMFLFPAHLWVIATTAMFCYAGIYAIKNEVISENP